MPLSTNLILSQSQTPASPTPQQLAIIKLNNQLRTNRKSTFQFSKSASNNEVTSLTLNTLTVTGTVIPNSDGTYSYKFKTKETNDAIKQDSEKNLKDVYIALKHKTQGVISRGQFVILTDAYGVHCTLDLKDEGEYEILIGSRAKP